MSIEGLASENLVDSLPDGAVSVSARNGSLVLKASKSLQDLFERLIERKKAGTLSDFESRQYRAICELDETLSRLNRGLRQPAG